ncbi:structural maintenance of chromosomes 5 [Osmia lignaria lignaria]|uniref:structural maintenance of chromosomes 5 n=1 Tax=Osmia lignaria lignaria TaxID=1437193 RepID=UPI00402BE0F5
MNKNSINKGIISYMYLENFVTYNSVSLKPGRNLNVIIGPNGTGKSTIVCAIVLGLGGKPTTIGRATHVAEYVKAGCEQAKIQIHLTNGQKDDIVICRQFNIQGKSSWLLNGNSSNIKEIQNLTKTLDIQVDNLCQFLPQDKVQDFSKMNAQELLENTERSVGDPIILEHHTNLIDCRSEHKQLESQITSKKRLLESKSQIYEGLKESVSSIKERKLIKKKIISLKQKKAWMIYEHKRAELFQLKSKMAAARKTVISLESEIKPINDLIEKLKSKIHSLQSSQADVNNKVRIKTSKMKGMLNDILEFENGIKEHETACKHRIQVEEARDHDIDVVKQQKNKLEDDLSLILKGIGSEDTLMKQQKEISSNIEKHRSIIAMLTSKHSALRQQEESMNLEIRAQETELQLLNIDAKRLQLLRERSLDTYKAVHWLRDNRDKFSGIIHEPILLNINVKDASYAKYLENTIPYRDLIAFVCENKKDMNLLLHFLRGEQKLQVNAVHSDPTKHISMEPNVPLEHIKQFGFTHYLASLIETPSTIMKYLVTMYNLNNIPVGTNLVDDNIDSIPHNIRYYFSRNNAYSVNRSKYTGEKSTTMRSVSSNGMLSIVLDKSKLSNIEQKLTRLKKEKVNALNKMKEIEEQMCEENKKLDEHRASRNKIQQDFQQVQALKSRISMVEKKIESLENERTSIDKIKELYTNKIKDILNKQLRMYRTYNKEFEEYYKYTIENEQTELILKLQNRSLRMKINDSQDMRDKLKIEEEKVRQISLELNPMKNETQRIYNEALQTTNGISPTDERFASLDKIFNKLPPTIEELNNELNIAQAKVFCMGNNIDGENILREYEDIEKTIVNLKEFIQKETQHLETLQQRMNMLREEWLKPLSSIVDKINSNFSSYFSAMNCAGEVTLAQPENNMDFDQYGLKIKVKFRDTDQLHELTRHHQSGGERAVTTAIYMISLQELTRVPFRCVDEINQGMDAVNERRVFDLLARMTGRPNSSQYFLLTPKLLPNLQYSKTVTVHCVFNGPFMINHTQFNTEDYCKHVVKTLEKENIIDD